MVSRRGARSLIFGLLGLIFINCEAIEYTPWLGNFSEFEWRNSLLYQHYSHVASHSTFVKRHADDVFFTTSLSNALPDFGVELELTAARTRKQRGDIDNFRFAGRYVWLDDVAGDPISLTTGAVLTQCFISSLKDISSFHHGRGEAEVFVSLGKEKAQGVEWGSRYWTVLGIGVADRGSAWVRNNYGFDCRLCQLQEIRLLVNTLWGMGHQRLRLHDFEGYGSLQHQSVDVGVRYTYLIDYVGNISLEYTYRPYARNFPAHTQRVMLTFLYTFGIL
jgi:hypothetical protein